jgi:hypothetical protein
MLNKENKMEELLKKRLMELKNEQIVISNKLKEIEETRNNAIIYANAIAFAIKEIENFIANIPKIAGENVIPTKKRSRGDKNELQQPQ